MNLYQLFTENISDKRFCSCEPATIALIAVALSAGTSAAAAAGAFSPGLPDPPPIPTLDDPAGDRGAAAERLARQRRRVATRITGPSGAGLPGQKSLGLPTLLGG